MSGTKYRGTATYFDWLPSGGGTVILWAESRTFEVQEQANKIDTTVRSDTAKRYLTDFPDITITMGGLDTSGTVLATNQPWDNINLGDSGTLRWGPEGTATNYRKRSLAARVDNKTYTSPYDGVVSWGLQFSSDGGTIVQAAWP